MKHGKEDAAMTKTKNRRIWLYAGIAALLLFAMGTSVVARFRFWWIYGICDSLRIRERNVIAEYVPGDGELYGISLDDAENGVGGVNYTNVLWLVNAEFPLSEGDVPAITDIDGEHSINAFAENDMYDLFSECENRFGSEILLVSTYRSRDLQASIYESNPYAVPAGTSEHETGLAFDIKIDGYAQKRFIMSNVGQWVDKNAYKYGFIIRYPFWGERVTEVEYEPWHLRYVGAPHAEIIYRSKITLEQYRGLYTEGKFYRHGGYVISYQSAGDGYLYMTRDARDICIYSDNTGGYFIWGELETD